MNPIRILLAALSLALFLLPPPIIAQSGSSIGSLPQPTAAGPDNGTTVKAGQSASNTDGVTVSNNTGSQGTAKLTPKAGTVNSETSVVTKSGFCGSVEGLDSNDNVTVGPNNTVEITGEGGTINAAGGSTITVKNTSPSTSSSNIVVQLPAGGSVTVPPGSTIKITT